MTAAASRLRNERLYFAALASLLALLMFAGFARSFYLHTLFGQPAPRLLLQVHGAIMTGWLALLLLQTALIFVRRPKWHKLSGYAGIAYAALILPIGAMATLGAARREVMANSAAIPSQLNVLGLELMQLTLFALLIAGAYLLRARTDFHKRLMVIATLVILPNAIVRLAFLSHVEWLQTNLALLTVWVALVIAVVGSDVWRNRRLHPAFGWSAALAILALYAVWYGSRTVLWDHYWIGVLGS
jgi:hypothetical protein